MQMTLRLNLSAQNQWIFTVVLLLLQKLIINQLRYKMLACTVNTIQTSKSTLTKRTDTRIDCRRPAEKGHLQTY